MQKRIILDQKLLTVTINRLCQQLIENHNDFSESVLIGLQPRGIYLAERISEQLTEVIDQPVKTGYLDITFFRDDFRRRDSPIKASATTIPFPVEDKKVILIDDVLFTGRSVRAAMDALNAYGRPAKIELLVLIDRRYTRELPVQPDYTGKTINSMISQKVKVEWKGVEENDKDGVWLYSYSGEAEDIDI